MILRLLRGDEGSSRVVIEGNRGEGGYLERGGRATGRQQFIDHTAWRLLEVENQAINCHPTPFNTQDFN